MKHGKENNIIINENSVARKSNTLAGSSDPLHTMSNKNKTSTQNALNKDLCDLFRIQAIQDMSSLSSITVDQLIHILDLDIVGLNYFKKALGFVSVDGNFHLRLDFRNLLERLLLLVKSKKNSLVKNLELTHDHIENDIFKKLIEL
ncbi:unnamed protein product [Rotaria sordida]|uniref:Uncharacterized protein n=1 Tax=Rotaria sordida TaxID=392033 RepID=A0A815B6N1_9BILA|nr:unnamed protein product [Rotaria sordida]CAF4058276.1 unnamed protein product [Rotaria sordida]